MRTKIMGILNTTPDSYFDGGCYTDLSSAIKKAVAIQNEGADFLDIGGYSTRPFADFVSVDEEIKRTIPLIKALQKEVTIPISIDTFRPQVAELALDAGAKFLNDISGFVDPAMRKLAAEYRVPICIMHMQGSPQTMQISPSYPEGVVEEIRDWLQKQVEIVLDSQIHPDQIYLDPGIGFGKTVDDNLKILQDLDKLRVLGFPLLIGTSRKSFIQKLTGQPADKALYGTLGVNSMLAQQGIEILRVHDVRAHRDLITMLAALTKIPVQA